MIAAILGKTGTVQDATVAKDRARYHRTHPDAARLFPTILIVVPSSVLYNWKKELETWGYFLVGMYWGAKKDEVLKYAEQGRYEVLLTTHDTFRAGAKALMFIPFSCMFVDEVHKLKNPMGQTTQTFKKFNVRRRYGLTGTAIQNTYEELWCLLDWCNPGKIMTYTEWKEHVSDPIRQGQAFGATAEQVDRRNVGIFFCFFSSLQVIKQLLTTSRFKRYHALTESTRESSTSSQTILPPTHKENHQTPTSEKRRPHPLLRTHRPSTTCLRSPY